MRAFEFLVEQQPTKKADLTALNQKLQYIQDQLLQGEIDDPATIDYIYKILMKPHIKQNIEGLIGTVAGKDEDVEAFNRLNNGILNKIIRKMAVSKEELDEFLNLWAKGKDLVKTCLLYTSPSPRDRG